MKGKRGDGGVVVGGGGQHLRDREGGDSTAVTVAIPEEEEEEHSHDRHSGTNDDNARARSTDTVSTSQQGNGVQANTDTKDSKTAATAATAATATAKKSKAPEPPVFPFLAAYPWLQYNSIMVVVVACALMFTGFHMVRDQLQDVCQPTVTKASFFLDEAVGDGHWFRTSWNPNSCLLHPYTSKRSDVASCLNGDTAVFIGDSRVRQLFQALVQTFDPTFEVTTEQRHQDIHFTDNTTNVSLSFLWQPEIISADVQRLYSDWAAALQSGTRAPAMIVHSAGLWAMKRGEPIDTLVQQAEQLRDAMSAIPRATPIYWLPISRVDESLLWESRKAITNNVIHHFNARCKHVFADSRNTQGDLVVFADRILDVAADFTETEDGLHFESSLPKQVHLLLNHLCHGVRTLRRGSRTCCAAPERTAPHQWLVLATFAGCCAFVALLVLNRRRIADKLADPPRSTRFFDSFAQAAAAVKKTHPRLFVVSTVALCMIFIFIADRTGVFMVAAKEFQWSHFSLGCLAILALGLVSVRTSAKAGALNRDQTDEWKGWMQLCFLLYHYTGASQVLSIYVFIRVCVAAYIFMTGFGHYIYFTQKKEFTWHRITMVVLRVNIFTLFLSMTMNRTYQFYYFVPLSTFWFLMVCLVMWALRGLDGRLALVKPFTLIAIAALLYYETEDGATPVFDFIFDHKLLAPLVELNGSLHEWRFRSGLDRYAAAAGMIVGHFIHTGNAPSRATMTTAIALSAAACAGYLWFAQTCESKPHCNARHVYLSPLLLAAFVVLRNSTHRLRSLYSAFFAECGKTSLELFLAQYHVWLAVDTKGVLVLLPGYPVLNAVVCTLIFMVISRTLATAFNALVFILLPKDTPQHGVVLRAIALLAALYFFSALAPK